MATPPEEKRATATGDISKNWYSSAVWFFELCEQTDRHIYSSKYFASLPGEK